MKQREFVEWARFGTITTTLALAALALDAAACSSRDQTAADVDATPKGQEAAVDAVPAETPFESSVPGDVAKADFASVLGAVRCEHAQRCCQAARYALDVAACKQHVVELWSDLDDPKTVYDPAAAGDCVRAQERELLTCFDRTLVIAEACRAVTTGTVPVGGDCTTARQCATPTGRERMACTAGKCEVTSRRQAKGEPCQATCTERYDRTISRCTTLPDDAAAPDAVRQICYTEDGIACGPARTCVTAPAVGEACWGPGTCAPNAFCGPASVCVALSPPGGACTDAYACASGQRCTAAGCVNWAAFGEPCATGECMSGMCDGATSTCGLVDVVDWKGLCAGAKL